MPPLMTQQIAHDADDDSEYADDITQMKTAANAHTATDDTSEIVESSNDAADLIVKLKAENTHFRTQLYSLTALLHKQQTDHLTEADKDKRITYLQRQITSIHSPSRLNALNNRITELQRAYDRECKERKTAERECKRLEKACLEVTSRTGSMPVLLERMERELHEEKIRSTELRRRAVTFEQSIRRMSIQCVEWSNKYEHEKALRIEAETTLSRVESENPELIARLEAASAPPMHDIAEEERLRAVVLKLESRIDHLNHSLKKQQQINTSLTTGISRLPATIHESGSSFSGTQPLPLRVKRPSPTLPTIPSNKRSTIRQRQSAIEEPQLPPPKPAVPVQRHSTKPSMQTSLPPVVPAPVAPSQRKTELTSNRKVDIRTTKTIKTTKSKAASITPTLTKVPSKQTRIPRPAADANKLQKALENTEQKDAQPSLQESEEILHLIQSITSSRSTMSSVVVSKPATGRIDTQRLVSPRDSERQNDIDDDYETDYEATDDEHQQHNDTVDIDESYIQTNRQPTIDEIPNASQFSSLQSPTDDTTNEIDDEYAPDTADDIKPQSTQNDFAVDPAPEVERRDDIPSNTPPLSQAPNEAETVTIASSSKSTSKRPSPISTPPRQDPKSSIQSRAESRHQTPEQVTVPPATSSRNPTPTFTTQQAETEPADVAEPTINVTENAPTESPDSGPGPIEVASPAYHDDEFGFGNGDDEFPAEETNEVSTIPTVVAEATEPTNAIEAEVASPALNDENLTSAVIENEPAAADNADNVSADVDIEPTASPATVIPATDENADSAELTDVVDLNALLPTDRAAAAEAEPDTSHYASDSDFES